MVIMGNDEFYFFPVPSWNYNDYEGYLSSFFHGALQEEELGVCVRMGEESLANSNDISLSFAFIWIIIDILLEVSEIVEDVFVSS